MMKIKELTITNVHEGLKSKEFSAQELTEGFLSLIKKREPELGALIFSREKEAISEAKEIDRKLEKGKELAPLAGVPVVIKDNILVKGTVTTAGSKILANYDSSYDATVIARLKKAGVIILGKSNMDEFGMGSSTENSAFKKTKNPWDLSRVPGGSSGGSAAAVAASYCPFALGSDTGGSVRQPASFCGVVGLKPTYGRVSRYGLVALASSLDQIGPIAKNVEDAGIVLKEIAGWDSKDSTTAKEKVPDYFKKMKEEIKGLKIGVPKEYFGSGLDPAVKKVIEGSLKKLEELGAKTVEVSLPYSQYALAVYYLILPAEASTNLARYDGVRYGLSYQEEGGSLADVLAKSRELGFGEEVKRRIMLGTFSLSAGYHDQYYLKAQQVRSLIVDDFKKAWQKVDCLVGPTTPTTAFKLGEKNNDPLTMYLSDIFTVSVNLAGLPAISVPAGLAEGLPVGLQIIGRPFDEETILKTAWNFEKTTNWPANLSKL